MASSDAHDALNGLRVLIVEDSWHLAAGLKQLLEKLGADVVGPVPTSVDAERLIPARIPDAAVVDIHLRKDEKSYGLIDRLRDRGVRTVVITGYSDVSVGPGKAVAVLQKPFNDEQLLAALHSSKTSKETDVG